MTELAHFRAPDGVRLAYDDQGTGPAVICLAGLTRTMGDFDACLPTLRAAGLRVIRPDMRGRGASDWTGPATYTVVQEAGDVLALMDHLGLARAAIIGTSRGGLIGMYLAAVAPARLTGLCLNDIGPVLERGGLIRIFDYLGRNPAAKTHADLAARMPALSPGFANVPHDRWLAEARRHYLQTPRGLQITYDPALREAFMAAFDGPAPDLWPLFDACAGLPLALIRGANSDLLSRETAAQMRARRPDMIWAEVPDRAHIPFLDEAESTSVLRDFARRIVEQTPGT